jgi:hypothetical protein
MKIVFLLLMLMSAPNQPSIKYKGVLYTTEVECEIAKAEYLNAYENKDRDYKDLIVTEAYCIPFDAFPLIKTKGMGA